MDILRTLGRSADNFLTRASCSSVETLRICFSNRGDVGDADDDSLTSKVEARGVGTANSCSTGPSDARAFGLGILSGTMSDRDLVRRFERRCGYRFDRNLGLRDGTGGMEESKASVRTIGRLNGVFFRVSFLGGDPSNELSLGSLKTTDPSRWCVLLVTRTSAFFGDASVIGMCGTTGEVERGGESGMSTRPHPLSEWPSLSAL